MDFVNRSNSHGRPSQPAAAPASNVSTASAPAGGDAPTPPRSARLHGKWFKFAYVTLLFGATALIVALLFFIAFGSPNQEGKFVKKDQLQAVFVNVNGTNGGQVYFGKIKELTPQYIRLTNVFYIQNQGQTAQANANSSYNLVKLGCELHGPDDEMLINRDEVFFWENLKNSSQVAQKANEYYKNSGGNTDCSQASNQQTQSTSNGTTTTPSSSSSDSSSNATNSTTGTGTSSTTAKPTTATPTTSTGGTTTTKKQ